MTNNSNNEMWFQEMDRTNPLDTTKSKERPEGSLNADTLGRSPGRQQLEHRGGKPEPRGGKSKPRGGKYVQLGGYLMLRGAEDQACQVQHHQDPGRELQHGGRA